MFGFKRRKLTKTVCAVLTTTLVLSCVSGCGKKTAKDKDAEGRTIISVGLWPDKEGVELDMYEGRKERFEKENPVAGTLKALQISNVKRRIIYPCRVYDSKFLTQHRNQWRKIDRQHVRINSRL